VTQEHFAPLSLLPPTRAQQSLALSIGASLLLLAAVSSFFAHIRLAPVYAFAPIVAAIEVVSYLLTATLLFASYSVRMVPALVALGIGYTFTGLMLIAWLLSFPGAFALPGLLGGSPQTSFYLAYFVNAGLGVSALVYVYLKKIGARRGRAGPDATIAVLAAIVMAAAAVWFVVRFGNDLPPMMIDSIHVSPNWGYVAPVFVLLYVVAIAAVAYRRTSVLDVWFLLALWAWLLESVMLLRFNYRFTVGWYLSLFFEFFSASVVFAALLFQLTTLYGRLAVSMAALRRERENRMLTVDAALASLAHQVFQPISAILTNAGTGLKEVSRDEIRRGAIEEILKDIATDSRRVGNALNAIRAVFRTGEREQENVQVFDLLRESVELAHAELQARRITVDVMSDAALPTVLGNRLQLQQVILNLVQNAADAMENVPRGPRQLRIGAVCDGDSVLVTVQDSGPGLARGAADRAFDPFFSTKSNGTGLGLAICRMIVEAHGGNIMLMAGIPAGTVAQFTLPIAHAA
jgi:signal transduction histidine kinase